MNGLTAAEIHARVDWPVVLQLLGIAEQFLRDKHGPCPVCGGKDRYRHDGKGRGMWICNQCGAGDGFALLMKMHGWSFSDTRRKVMGAAGIAGDDSPPRAWPVTAPAAPQIEMARPTARVRDLLRSSCDPADVSDVRAYLASRHLWPLPAGCALKAHPTVEYWEEGQRIGRYPALIAPVRDIDGHLITVHVTYLQSGRKIANAEPRKILSPLTGRTGCAVRLMRLDGDTLGIAEGVETALAAARLHGVPTWSALNASLLQKFEPPAGVRKVIVFADRDIAGLEAAGKLLERLQGRISVELRTAPSPHKDWADVLSSRVGGAA
jgi:putative DNA primase/helicase